MSLSFEEEQITVASYSQPKESKIYNYFIKLGLAKDQQSAKRVAFIFAIILILASAWISFGDSISRSFNRSSVSNPENTIETRIEQIRNDDSLSQEEKEARIRFQERRLNNN